AGWRPPGGTEPDRAVTCHVVPPPDAYCSDQAARSTVVLPRLNSSTKSFVYGAPELPPPAKTWLITMSAEALWAAGATSSNAARASMKKWRNRGIGSSRRVAGLMSPFVPRRAHRPKVSVRDSAQTCHGLVARLRLSAGRF